LFNRVFSFVTDLYVGGVRFFVHHVGMGLAIFVLICVSAFYMFAKVPKVPKSLVPAEDQGLLMASFVMLPSGASLDRTAAVMSQTEPVFQKNLAVESTTAIAGYDMLSGGLKSSAGAFFLTLKDWSPAWQSARGSAEYGRPVYGADKRHQGWFYPAG